MAFAFKDHQSWNALQDPNSQLVNFLNDFCVTEGKVDARKLKALGILWCDGKPSEKIDELYDILQDDNQEEIAASDKDIKVIFRLLFDIATDICFGLEPKYMNTEREFDEEKVKGIQENYDDQFIDEILDSIYGV